MNPNSEYSFIYQFFFGHRLPSLDKTQEHFTYSCEPVQMAYGRWSAEWPPNTPNHFPHFFTHRNFNILDAIKLSLDGTAEWFITQDYPDRKGPKYYLIPDRSSYFSQRK